MLTLTPYNLHKTLFLDRLVHADILQKPDDLFVCSMQEMVSLMHCLYVRLLWNNIDREKFCANKYDSLDLNRLRPCHRRLSLPNNLPRSYLKRGQMLKLTLCRCKACCLQVWNLLALFPNLVSPSFPHCFPSSFSITPAIKLADQWWIMNIHAGVLTLLCYKPYNHKLLMCQGLNGLEYLNPFMVWREVCVPV